MRMDCISLEMDMSPHMDYYRPGHVLVGISLDPMIGLEFELWSMDCTGYLDLLGTLLGPCSHKAKPRQTQTLIVSWVGTNIHSVVLSSAFGLIITGRSYCECWVSYHDEHCCKRTVWHRVRSMSDECGEDVVCRSCYSPASVRFPHSDCVKYGRAAA